MVKIWRHETIDDKYVDARIKDLRPFRAIALSAGKSLTGVFPAQVTALVESANGPSDYFTAGPMKIISEKLKGFFVSSDANAEYFPVTILHDAKELGAYFCFNLLETVDCFDWEASKYLPEKGFARHISKLVLRTSVIQNQPLFRIARTVPVLMAVSEDLETKVREAKCTGIILSTPEEWRNPDKTIKG